MTYIRFAITPWVKFDIDSHIVLQRFDKKAYSAVTQLNNARLLLFLVRYIYMSSKVYLNWTILKISCPIW